MVTGEHVSTIAQRNYEAAEANKDADLAAATSVAQSVAIEANFEQAMAAYLETIIAGFKAKTGDWDALVGEAEAAEQALTAAREKAEGVAATITAMGTLTGAVTNLVNAVKQAPAGGGQQPAGGGA
jgi:hypothetical protein